MQTLRKFAGRSATDRRLLTEALVTVPAVRLALCLLPFRFARRRIGRSVSKRRATTTPEIPAERIVWAVTAVAARVPRASCLTQALAASILLPRYGHDATLRVGVAKDGDGRLHAHAWLESRGTTILGGPEPGAFEALPPIVLS